MIERLSEVLGEEMRGIYPHKTEEKFPRIAEKIALLWGTPSMARYFSELLFDDRGGRAGFPPDVMTELFRLSNYYDTTRAARSAADSTWDSGEQQRLDRFSRMNKT